MSLPTVKCKFSSIDLNDQFTYDEFLIKGRLVLTTFKLQFIPHKSESTAYSKCYSPKTRHYFKYWNENDIPLTFVYGIYTCESASHLF